MSDKTNNHSPLTTDEAINVAMQIGEDAFNYAYDIADKHDLSFQAVADIIVSALLDRKATMRVLEELCDNDCETDDDDSDVED